MEGPEHQGIPTTILVDQANAQGGKITTEDGQLISQLADGAFAGKSERDVAFEACKWWRGVLDALDARARDIAK